MLCEDKDRGHMGNDVAVPSYVAICHVHKHIKATFVASITLGTPPRAYVHAVMCSCRHQNNINAVVQAELAMQHILLRFGHRHNVTCKAGYNCHSMRQAKRGVVATESTETLSNLAP